MSIAEDFTAVKSKTFKCTFILHTRGKSPWQLVVAHFSRTLTTHNCRLGWSWHGQDHNYAHTQNTITSQKPCHITAHTKAFFIRLLRVAHKRLYFPVLQT